MKLRLNIATAPQANNRPFLAGAAALGALALIALVVLARETYVSRQADLQIRSDTARLEQQIQTDKARQQDLQNYFQTAHAKQVMDRAKFLNSLIAESQD